MTKGAHSELDDQFLGKEIFYYQPVDTFKGFAGEWSAEGLLETITTVIAIESV